METKTHHLLKPHDEVKKGDQFRRAGRWLNCTLITIGTQAGNWSYQFRRKN